MRNRRLGQDRVLEIGERVETILTAPLDVDIEHDKPGAVAPGGNTDQRLRPALPPWCDQHLIRRCGMKAAADEGPFIVSSTRENRPPAPAINERYRRNVPLHNSLHEHEIEHFHVAPGPSRAPE